ncbi:MAG: TetR/AcrR family transcriptional regulator [Eggerthellaceae bacterium]|jgi:AcrR family transcriptional regulator
MADETKQDARILRGLQTKRKLQDAFIEIYASTPIEKISIRQITDRAHLNRGTFYIHFSDIYDMRDKIVGEFAEQIELRRGKAVSEVFGKGNLSSVLPDESFYRENEKYLKVLLCIPGKSDLGTYMKAAIERTLEDALQERGGKDSPYRTFALEYFASAVVGVITRWVADGMQVPLASLSDEVARMSREGVVGYLLETGR